MAYLTFTLGQVVHWLIYYLEVAELTQYLVDSTYIVYVEYRYRNEKDIFFCSRMQSPLRRSYPGRRPSIQLHEIGSVGLAQSTTTARKIIILRSTSMTRGKRPQSSSPTLTMDWHIVDIQRYICSTCLLYTSPSPRDLSTSRMPSSA